jgi:hypothetical protein
MKAGTGEKIPRLIHTAQTLKRARRMQQEFMLMWALDRAQHADELREERQNRSVQNLADSTDRDWRMFRRGSGLDE